MSCTCTCTRTPNPEAHSAPPRADSPSSFLLASWSTFLVNTENLEATAIGRSLISDPCAVHQRADNLRRRSAWGSPRQAIALTIPMACRVRSSSRLMPLQRLVNEPERVRALNAEKSEGMKGEDDARRAYLALSLFRMESNVISKTRYAYRPSQHNRVRLPGSSTRALIHWHALFFFPPPSTFSFPESNSLPFPVLWALTTVPASASGSLPILVLVLVLVRQMDIWLSPCPWPTPFSLSFSTVPNSFSTLPIFALPRGRAHMHSILFYSVLFYSVLFCSVLFSFPSPSPFQRLFSSLLWALALDNLAFGLRSSVFGLWWSMGDGRWAVGDRQCIQRSPVSSVSVGHLPSFLSVTHAHSPRAHAVSGGLSSFFCPVRLLRIYAYDSLLWFELEHAPRPCVIHPFIHSLVRSYALLEWIPKIITGPQHQTGRLRLLPATCTSLPFPSLPFFAGAGVGVDSLATQPQTQRNYSISNSALWPGATPFPVFYLVYLMDVGVAWIKRIKIFFVGAGVDNQRLLSLAAAVANILCTRTLSVAAPPFSVRARSFCGAPALTSWTSVFGAMGYGRWAMGDVYSALTVSRVHARAVSSVSVVVPATLFSVGAHAILFSLRVCAYVRACMWTPEMPIPFPHFIIIIIFTVQRTNTAQISFPIPTGISIPDLRPRSQAAYKWSNLPKEPEKPDS
ncbi:hypothetical protein B0H13DRAFT_2321954 [Mycena leptocephala]|nr:hypothetical protein B0H13DRAFT_2321954 [Mycena leptocephala]